RRHRSIRLLRSASAVRKGYLAEGKTDPAVRLFEAHGLSAPPVLAVEDTVVLVPDKEPLGCFLLVPFHGEGIHELSDPKAVPFHKRRLFCCFLVSGNKEERAVLLLEVENGLPEG